MPQGKVLVLCALMRNYRLCFMLAIQNLLIAEVICRILVHIKRSTNWINYNNIGQASRVPVCRPTRREEARVPVCQPSNSQINKERQHTNNQRAYKTKISSDLDTLPERLALTRHEKRLGGGCLCFITTNK